jgi:hypothetical protein
MSTITTKDGAMDMAWAKLSARSPTPMESKRLADAATSCTRIPGTVLSSNFTNPRDFGRSWENASMGHD